jgi:serine/threonine-protein kinase
MVCYTQKLKVDPQATREASLMPWIGRMLADKYRIVRVLGTGGHAAVFEATHVWTRRRVAVKIQSEQIARSPEAAARFLREARAAASLSHPNIVEVLDMGRDGADGPLYLVQEFLDGGDLRQLLNARGRLSPEEAAAIVAQVARGLAVAHQRGVYHRDVKPGNILLALQGEGQRVPKMIDFGISRMDDGEGKVTTTGIPVGTPGYMSPEQALGERAGAESDIWALGIVLYECLTGRRPFSASNYTQLLRLIVSEDAPRVETLNPAVPRSLADITHRALCRDLAGRFATMGDFADALATVAPSLPDGVQDDATHIRMAPAPDPSLQALGSAPPRSTEDRSSPSLLAPTEPDMPVAEPSPEPSQERPARKVGASIPSFVEGSGGSMRFPTPIPPVSLLSFADDTFSQEPTRKRPQSPAVPLAIEPAEGQDLFASESLPAPPPSRSSQPSQPPSQPSYPPSQPKFFPSQPPSQPSYPSSQPSYPSSQSSFPSPQPSYPLSPPSYAPGTLAPPESLPSAAGALQAPTQSFQAPVASAPAAGLDPLRKVLLAFFFLVATIAAAVGGIWLGRRHWPQRLAASTSSPTAPPEPAEEPAPTPPPNPTATPEPAEVPAPTPSPTTVLAPALDAQVQPSVPVAPDAAMAEPVTPITAPAAEPAATTPSVADPATAPPQSRPRPRPRRRRPSTDGLFWLPR